MSTGTSYKIPPRQRPPIYGTTQLRVYEYVTFQLSTTGDTRRLRVRCPPLFQPTLFSRPSCTTVEKAKYSYEILLGRVRAALPVSVFCLFFFRKFRLTIISASSALAVVVWGPLQMWGGPLRHDAFTSGPETVDDILRTRRISRMRGRGRLSPSSPRRRCYCTRPHPTGAGSMEAGTILVSFDARERGVRATATSSWETPKSTPRTGTNQRPPSPPTRPRRSWASPPEAWGERNPEGASVSARCRDGGMPPPPPKKGRGGGGRDGIRRVLVTVLGMVVGGGGLALVKTLLLLLL